MSSKQLCVYRFMLKKFIFYYWCPILYVAPTALWFYIIRYRGLTPPSIFYHAFSVLFPRIVIIFCLI